MIRKPDEGNKSTMPHVNELYVVRLYDGFDNLWMDVSGPVPKEEADRIWKEKTDDGKKMTKFDDIDYYAVFPADTRMLYRDKSEGGLGGRDS